MLHVGFFAFSGIGLLSDRNGMNTKKAKDNLETMYVRPARFAELTGMSRRVVYQYIYAGKLNAHKIGRTLSIPVSELTDFYTRNDEFQDAA